MVWCGLWTCRVVWWEGVVRRGRFNLSEVWCIVALYSAIQYRRVEFSVDRVENIMLVLVCCVAECSGVQWTHTEQRQVIWCSVTSGKT